MVYRQQIVCDNIEFAESKSVSQQNAGAYQAPQYQQAAPAPVQTPAPAPVSAPDISGDGFMNIPDGIDEELPFS